MTSPSFLKNKTKKNILKTIVGEHTIISSALFVYSDITTQKKMKEMLKKLKKKNQNLTN
jgi:hypothetical protein